MNDVPPKPYDQQDDEEDLPNFCPFSHQIIPGPLGQVTIRRPMCEPKHCKLGDANTGSCAAIEVLQTLRRIGDALEEISSALSERSL